MISGLMNTRSRSSGALVTNIRTMRLTWVAAEADSRPLFHGGEHLAGKAAYPGGDLGNRIGTPAERWVAERDDGEQ